MGLSATQGECDPGFFCPTPSGSTGAITPRPDANKCTAGNYCPKKSTMMQPCPAGTYTNNDYQSSCLDCPAGYSCASGAQPVACPIGNYCPANSGTPTKCPLG